MINIQSRTMPDWWVIIQAHPGKGLTKASSPRVSTPLVEPAPCPCRSTRLFGEFDAINARLLELEKAAKDLQPDARKLGKIATWMKNKLEDWRTVSPKGTEKFEEEMGSNAAKFVGWGVAGVGSIGLIAFAKLSGVLDSPLTWLEAALAIVRPVIGL